MFVCIKEADAFGKIPFARSNDYEVTIMQVNGFN
jgi:hypothetical protein